jgi:hypothetical protein
MGFTPGAFVLLYEFQSPPYALEPPPFLFPEQSLCGQFLHTLCLTFTDI